MAFYDPFTLDKDTLRARVGPLTLYLQRTTSEVLAAWEYDQAERSFTELEPPAAADAPADASWQRWALRMADARVQFVPTMPDRSIVARPEEPVHVPAGQQARFYVSVPLWLTLNVLMEPELKLFEVPTHVLSNTWFGDPMSGELCYGLRTRARRDFKHDEEEAYRVMCPVLLKNEHSQDLLVERILLRATNLEIFRGSTRLWSNVTTVRYRGPDRDISFEINSARPSDEPIRDVHARARDPKRRGLLSAFNPGRWSLGR